MVSGLKEKSATIGLAAIMAFRMLGLFMILPVFSIQAIHYSHSSPQLVGIALGIYGFTQACFQIPLATLSDKIGRKIIILTGLIVFILGSVIAAFANDIYILILGRALQGAGAVGSTVLALLADLTREESRSKAMAIVGLAIGSSFSLAMVLGPLLNAWLGFSSIFWFTAALATSGIFLLVYLIPTPPKIFYHQDLKTKRNNFFSTLKNFQLLRLNYGIFILHASLTSLFIIIPILLQNHFQLKEIQQSLFYLITLTISFFLMVPFIIFAEKKQKMKVIFLSSILLLVFSQLCLMTFQLNLLLFGANLLIFLTAFSFLEATVPSWITKIIPINKKGSAMGIYSSFQFFGIFCGGTLGGLTYSHFGVEGIFSFNSLLLLSWLLASWNLESPPYLSTVIFQLKQFTEQDPALLSQQLSQLPAIAEVAILVNEGLVYLKIKQQLISKDELPKQLERSNLIELDGREAIV